MRRVFLSACLGAAAAACGTLPYTDDMIAAWDDTRLCIEYGDVLRGTTLRGEGRQKVIDAVWSRRLADVDSDELIRQRKIRLGISECTLHASWGRATRENRSVGSWGVRIQHVYGSRNYVYTRNGRVESWQN